MHVGNYALAGFLSIACSRRVQRARFQEMVDGVPFSRSLTGLQSKWSDEIPNPLIAFFMLLLRVNNLAVGFHIACHKLAVTSPGKDCARLRVANLRRRHAKIGKEILPDFTQDRGEAQNSWIGAAHPEFYAILSLRHLLSRADVKMQLQNTAADKTESSHVNVLPSVRLALEQLTFGEALYLEAWVHGSTVHREFAYLALGDGESGEDTFLRACLELPKKYSRLYAAGSRVAFSGILEQSRWGGAQLRVQNAKLLQVAPTAWSVCRVLSAATPAEGLLPADEAKAALLFDVDALLPSATDRVAVDMLTASLRSAAPGGAIDAANGLKPQPSAARDPQLVGLLQQEGMQRVCMALEAAGGAAAGATALDDTKDAKDLPHGLIVLDGEVTGRCQFSRGFLSIDLCTNENMIAKFVPQRCIVHASFCGNSTLAYTDLAVMGARLRFAGVWAPQEESSNVLFVVSARLLRSSAVMKALHSLLSKVADGSVDAVEAMVALSISPAEGASQADGQAFRKALQAESRSERNWHVADLNRALAANSVARSRAQRDSFHNSVDTPQNDIVSTYEVVLQSLDNLRACYPVRKIDLCQQESMFATVSDEGVNQKDVGKHQHQQLQQNRQTDWSMRGARPERRVNTGAVTHAPMGSLRDGRDGSFWQTKKRPQVLFMTQIIADLLSAHPSWSQPGGECMHILDIGGSKGLLALHLAERFGSRVNVTVVDIKPSRLAVGSRRAQRLGSGSNIQFVAGDASELVRTGRLGRVDIVVGLHACGGLSDVILGHAVIHGAAFAITTCCYLSHQTLEVQDSNGSAISRNEWLGAVTSQPAADVADAVDVKGGVLTPELLQQVMRAAERANDPEMSALGAHTMNAIRANAVRQRWSQRWHRHQPEDRNSLSKVHSEGSNQTRYIDRALSVELLSFEPKYSLRNFVIVGTPIH